MTSLVTRFLTLFGIAVQPLEVAPQTAPEVSLELQTFRRLSRDIYWEQDESGLITRVDDGPNPSALKLRIGGFLWDDGALPLETGDWQEHRDRLARQEAFTDFAWVWNDPSGRTRVSIDSGVPRHDSQGRFLGFTGVSRDASIDTAADRARRLATAALLAASEPVVWIEADSHPTSGWRIIWANAAACQLFDRTERELRELPCRTLFGPDSGGACGSIEQALLARRDTRLQAELARKYGECRTVEVRLEPLAGTGSLRACAALLIHDRSAEQERLQQGSRAIDQLRSAMQERTLELETAARELESFTYSVSHDLRAPIRVIEGFARILDEDYADRLDRVGHEHLQRILTSANRMTQMVDALLELARLSGQPLATEPVDLSRLADLIAEQLRANDPSLNARITVQPGIQVEGDRTLLRIVLENLMSNALKFSAKQPDAHIEFACSGAGPATVYCMSDNGDGFDMRFADRLFGVFQRLHTESEFKGTGVGLANIRERLQMLYGTRATLTVAENQPSGTIVTVTVPYKPVEGAGQ